MKYPLKFPFTNAAGVKIEAVEMRRLKRRDVKAAVNYSTNEVDQEDFLLARLSGLTVEDIEELDIADSRALIDFFRGVAEGSPEPAAG
ncbi:phage tail assembly protein [Burkholderia ubonensis]|uniref:phage tail assembly protein n=1 Tax=Burkholderia ubonensis TaxID=101571 RepID=UPI0009B3520F|nr:phage tail assembly protein [Burkholderia ubonensis]